MDDNQIKMEGTTETNKGNDIEHSTVEAAIPSTVEGAIPSIVEAAKPSTVEATIPSNVDAAIPSTVIPVSNQPISTSLGVVTNVPYPPKPDLIATAVTFLENPSVFTRSKQDKINFLKRKGLSDLEISTAFMTVENTVPLNHVQQLVPATYDGFATPVIPQRCPTSAWSTAKTTANVLFLVSGAVYGCHSLCQWILKNYFIEQKRKDPIEEFQTKIGKTVDKLQNSVDLLMDLIKSQKKTVNGEKDEIISQLASIKSLLLNKHSFPAAPVTGITLPDWQIPKKKVDVSPDTESKRQTPPLVDNTKTSSKISVTESLSITSVSDVSNILDSSTTSSDHENVDASLKVTTDDPATTVNEIDSNC